MGLLSKSLDNMMRRHLHPKKRRKVESMNLIVIENFSEAVDPMARGKRLKGIYKAYSRYKRIAAGGGGKGSWTLGGVKAASDKMVKAHQILGKRIGPFTLQAPRSRTDYAPLHKRLWGRHSPYGSMHDVRTNPHQRGDLAAEFRKRAMKAGKNGRLPSDGRKSASKHFKQMAHDVLNKDVTTVWKDGRVEKKYWAPKTPSRGTKKAPSRLP